jgi:RimJ/RimL family protein N-acetyltransferase
VSVVLEEDGIRLRLAGEDDIDYLHRLAASEEVEPFLAGVSPWGRDDVRADIVRAQTEPDAGARIVLEIEDGRAWRPAGGLAYAVQNRRSRIVHLYGVMLDPSARGRGLAERAVRLVATHLIRERGYHRVQLEVYAFNERALRLFERAGFVREGAKRKAYWRHGAWHDGVLFGLVAEDLATRNEAAEGGLSRAVRDSSR